MKAMNHKISLELIIDDEGIDKLQVYETTNWQLIKTISKCVYPTEKKCAVTGEYCRGYNEQCEKYMPMRKTE